MNLIRLAQCNIAGNPFRSWVVALCALLITGLALASGLFLLGAETSLQLAVARLGADILVVPEGKAAGVESALLMGRPTEAWMPESVLDDLAAVPGVETVSPQLYLATLTNASCCSVSDMFLIVFDPATDFVVTPWLKTHLGGGLHRGEVIGGCNVSIPPGEKGIRLYGSDVVLRAKMEPTGTGLDQSVFMTLETAREIARDSRERAVKPLEIPSGRISAVLVKVRTGYLPEVVMLEIQDRLRGVTPVLSPDMFRSYRQQLSGLTRGAGLMLVLVLAILEAVICLVFSMAAHERRRELGVLRALGAPRTFVLRSLLLEAGILALNGGLVGILLTFMAMVLFRNLIIATLGIPFLLPSYLALALSVGAGLIWAALSVTMAALIPAYRISHEDPAAAMRE